MQWRTKVVEEVAERRFRCLLLRFRLDRREMTYLMNNSHTIYCIKTDYMYNLQQYTIYSVSQKSSPPKTFCNIFI